MSMDESLGKQTANEFLKYASEYANSIDNDDGFISEIAYIMTTLDDKREIIITEGDEW